MRNLATILRLHDEPSATGYRERQNLDRVSSSSTHHSPLCSHHPQQQTVTKQAGVAVTTMCAGKLPGSNLGRDTGCHG